MLQNANTGKKHHQSQKNVRPTIVFFTNKYDDTENERLERTKENNKLKEVNVERFQRWFPKKLVGFSLLIYSIIVF